MHRSTEVMSASGGPEEVRRTEVGGRARDGGKQRPYRTERGTNVQTLTDLDGGVQDRERPPLRRDVTRECSCGGRRSAVSWSGVSRAER